MYVVHIYSILAQKKYCISLILKIQRTPFNKSKRSHVIQLTLPKSFYFNVFFVSLTYTQLLEIE